MVFTLRDVSKRYGIHWLFRQVNLELKENTILGVAGPNGSGKSTLLKVMAGFVSPTEGEVTLQMDNQEIRSDSLAQRIAFTAPYITPPLDFRLRELCDFYCRFRSMQDDITISSMIGRMQLDGHEEKILRDFSSGMLQRVKLGLALYTDSPIILLDEPTSNLDVRYKNWFSTELKSYINDRICIIASNEEQDLQHAERRINIGHG